MCRCKSSPQGCVPRDPEDAGHRQPLGRDLRDGAERERLDRHPHLEGREGGCVGPLVVMLPQALGGGWGGMDGVKTCLKAYI